MLLLAADVTRQGVRPASGHASTGLTLFLKKFGPATLGSAGTQVALFADTIIASFLTTGALSALYYADRLNQLPIGVIGIAVGTVLLPEMSKRLAAGDEAGAHHSQNRAVELTLLLSVPCVVAFLMVPDLIMRALFTRGAFTTADAQAAAATLAAYALGLLPFVLLRNASITFLARGDTVTPVKALAVSVAVNVALKIALMGPLAQVGLALATAVGAWVNLSLLIWFAARQRLIVLDARLVRAIWRIAVAAIALALVLWLAQAPITALFSQWTRLRYEAMLATLGVLGACVYIGTVLALFGREWIVSGVPLSNLRRRSRLIRSTSTDRSGRGLWHFHLTRRCELQRRAGVDQTGAELLIRPELFGARRQDAANVGGREVWIALQHQGDDAAHMRGRDRGAGRHLVGAFRCRHQDVDAGCRDRDVVAAVCAGEQLVVDVGRGHRDDVLVGGREQRRRFWPGVAGGSNRTTPRS